MRALAVLAVSVVMLLPEIGLATDMGPPTAGFDSGGFTLRTTLKGTSAQYLLRDGDDGASGTTEYRASFAAGGAEVALGFQDRVRFTAMYGAGGFNAYDQVVGGPDGGYRVYGGGARVTIMRMKAAPVEIGAGVNLTWWDRKGDVSAGEWTVMTGLAVRPIPGNTLYAGAQYFTVGGTQPVTAEVGTSEAQLRGEAAALYGGYELRLAVLSLRAEARAEAPVFHRLGFGLSMGVDF